MMVSAQAGVTEKQTNKQTKNNKDRQLVVASLIVY